MSAHASAGELPRWLSSRSIAAVGSGLALAIVALAVAFLAFERLEIRQRRLQDVEVFARVLQDHADRTADTVDIALTSLADTVRRSPPGRSTATLATALAQAQQGMPFVRSVSLMDGGGRVLASTEAANVGVQVDLDRLPLPLPGRVDRLGPLIHSRDLADIPQAQGAGPPRPVDFLPLVRSVPMEGQAPLYLVAVLNPDYFATEHQLLLADPSRAAALVALDGTVISATETLRTGPGQTLPKHRFLREFLPVRESGSFIGPGIDGSDVVTALRTMRRRPVAVIVEMDYAEVLAEWQRTAGWVSGVAALALLLIGSMSLMAWRGLRGHESSQTALAESRARVAASERDLRTLVQSVHELLFRTDGEGRIGFVNERWEQITGHSAQAALGRPLADFCVEADRPQVQALFAGAAKAAATVRLLNAAGEALTLELSAAALLAEDGRINGYAGFAVDVSERQRARQRLQAQLEFTARLLEVSPTPLFAHDERGRLVTVNQACMQMMGGSSVERVIGRTLGDIFGPRAAFHEEQARGLARPGDRVSYEHALRRPNMPPRDVVITQLRLAAADGQPGGILGSIVDVTEFREAERSTRAGRDAAERNNRAKSEFIANISHELRTPLQSIIGFSELGAEMARGHPSFREMFQDIHGGGLRMLSLVNGLLDVSKLESQAAPLDLRHQPVVALLAPLLHELSPLAMRRRVFIDSSGVPETLQIFADTARFQQVLRNVLANALRFAPEASTIEVGAQDHGAGGVELSVRDRGPGIPDDELESVFDAFVQSSRTKDGAGGTGLGLTISRQIVTAHGGRIEAANATDGGAVVRILLPAFRSVAGSVPDPA